MPFKNDVVNVIAGKAGITKEAAGMAVNTFIACVENALKKGDRLTIPGFGTFSVLKRKARTGRNPATGEKMRIRTKKVPKFRAGKGLREAVG